MRLRVAAICCGDHFQLSIVRTASQPTPLKSSLPAGRQATRQLAQAACAACEPYGNIASVLRSNSRVIVDGLRISARAMARALNPRMLRAGHRHPILGLKLAVLRRLFHVHTLRWGVLHFGFETAHPCSNSVVCCSVGSVWPHGLEATACEVAHPPARLAENTLAILWRFKCLY
jgi:hypothetical protein